MDEPAAYDVEFDWEDAHGRLVQLLTARSERGIVIDLGCGYAPHAEPLRDAGFTYVGLDINDVAVEAVSARGFDARSIDLGNHVVTMDVLKTIVAGGDSLAAVLAIDVIEHLVEPQLLLAELSSWLETHPSAVLGVSVPNVAHRDIALKLLGGRWDVTPTGLLDHTHVRFFTAASLEALMTSAGLREVVRDDRPAERSDQYWPAGAPTIAEASRAGAWLRALRRRADDHDATYQFIRLYRSTGDPATPTIISGEASVSSSGSSSGVFLSVLADPGLAEDDLDRVRSMLATQTSPSWELLTAADGADTVTDVAGGAGGAVDPTTQIARMIGAAQGTYVSIIEVGDVVSDGWVEQFERAAHDGGGLGAILRCATAVDGDGTQSLHPAVAELGPLQAASTSFAIPSDAIRGLRLDPGDGVLSPGLGLLLDAVQFCGVVDTGVEAVAAWRSADVDASAVADRLSDGHPELMPAGTRRRLVDLDRARLDAESRASELDEEAGRLQRDNAWLNGELALAPVKVVRRLLRRPPSSD